MELLEVIAPPDAGRAIQARVQMEVVDRLTCLLQRTPEPRELQEVRRMRRRNAARETYVQDGRVLFQTAWISPNELGFFHGGDAPYASFTVDHP
jgi:hypothetical protein